MAISWKCGVWQQLSALSILGPEDRLVVSCAYMRVQPELFDQLKTQQLKDEMLAQILADIDKFSPLDNTLRSDGIL